MRACVLDRAESVGLIECGPKGAKVRVALVTHYGRADMPGFLDFELRKQNFDAVQVLRHPHPPAPSSGTFHGPPCVPHLRRQPLPLRHHAAPAAGGRQPGAAWHLLGLPKLTVPTVIDETGCRSRGSSVWISSWRNARGLRGLTLFAMLR